MKDAIIGIKHALLTCEYEKARAILKKRKVSFSKSQYEYWNRQIQVNQKNEDMKNPTLARGIFTTFICLEAFFLWLGSLAIIYYTNNNKGIYLCGLTIISLLIICINRTLKSHYDNKYGFVVFRKYFHDLITFMNTSYLTILVVFVVFVFF